MENYCNYAFIAVLSLLFLSINSCGDESQEEISSHMSQRHNLVCILVGNEWKIVDARDPSRAEIFVARGDTVVWQAPDNTDIYFQFMDDELTGTFTRELLQGESLTLVVGNEAKSGDNPYAVFVHDAREYAKGESPPRMIVR